MTTTAPSREAAAASATAPSHGSMSSDRLWDTQVGKDPAFLLARANALSLARMHDVLAEYGLQARSYSLLAIAAADARPSQRELSEFLRLDPSQIVALIDQLERRDLVRREPDPNDRRAKVVIATESGRELAARARDSVVESDQGWFAQLPSADDRDALFSALRTLADPRA
ncbi:MarR family transcriptional regulator [Leucobacter sp. gxy201]|uniref:MarR family winged helix-turn-helix transcriptional regulator n=1 Tax=Leucobacter sp. gxy201 TaxID=2957200 RepID=UPI003DA03CD5